MSLAAWRSEVLLGEAPIQDQALQRGVTAQINQGLIWNQSRLKSNIETLEQ